MMSAMLIRPVTYLILCWLPLVAAARVCAKPAETGTDFGPTENGLALKISTKQASYKVGEPIDIVFTFKNTTDKELQVLDGSYNFHQFEFIDSAGKPISQTAPTIVVERTVLLRGKLEAGATLQHVVRLNAWKLAGLGHPATEIGKEARTIAVTGVYATPAGLDLKDPTVWAGLLKSNTITIRIED
jgi:hypothetical protein